MASPSVTYSFSNSTIADATQVNQNFSDIINGITDGTKDLSISALTTAGASNLGAAVTLGASSTNDLIINAAIAQSIAIKTNTTYDLGAATKGMGKIYLGGASTKTVALSGGTISGSSYTFTFPVAVPVSSAFIKADTSANASFYIPVAPTVKAFLQTKYYTFTVTAANATLAATFTNNAQTFTVVYTIAGTTTLVCSGTGAPGSSGTLTKSGGTGDSTITFASVVANGTYNLPSGCFYIRVRMVGGGGGGGAVTSAGAGSDGGDTTFGSSFLTAGGGKGGPTGVNSGNRGGLGGTSTIVGPTGLLPAGNAGGGGVNTTNTGTAMGPGGNGGGGAFFGGGGSGQGNNSGTASTAGAVNTGGGGGGGAGGNNTQQGGSGGGGAGGIDVIITSPSATYVFTIGAGGAGNGGGSAGGDGAIYVEEIYQ